MKHQKLSALNIFARMGAAFKFYKRRFRNSLQPLFVMLIAKKASMDREQWFESVKNTMVRVTTNPGEFLGSDIPDNSLIRDIIEDLFSEFLKEKGSR